MLPAPHPDDVIHIVVIHVMPKISDPDLRFESYPTSKIHSSVSYVGWTISSLVRNITLSTHANSMLKLLGKICLTH